MWPRVMLECHAICTEPDKNSLRSRPARPGLREPAGAYAVHFWNEVWHHNAMDKDAAWPADSLYESLKRRYGVRA